LQTRQTDLTTAAHAQAVRLESINLPIPSAFLVLRPEYIGRPLGRACAPAAKTRLQPTPAPIILTLGKMNISLVIDARSRADDNQRAALRVEVKNAARRSFCGPKSINPSVCVVQDQELGGLEIIAARPK